MRGVEPLRVRSTKRLCKNNSNKFLTSLLGNLLIKLDIMIYFDFRKMLNLC